MDANSELGAVILAAGRGTRLGGPKALCDLDGEALLCRVLRTLERAAEELGCALNTVVVSGADRETVRAALALWPLRERPPLLANDEPQRERTHSLRLGVAALRAGRPFLVWPVDVPLVLPATLRALARAPLDARAFRVPCCDGRGGHPVLLGAALRERVLALHDGESLRVLREEPGVLCERIEVGDPGVLLDLDEPGDVAHALDLLHRRKPPAA